MGRRPYRGNENPLELFRIILTVWFTTNNTLGMCFLSFSKIFNDFIQIILMRFRILIPNTPNLRNDLIFIHFKSPKTKVQVVYIFLDWNIQIQHKLIELLV
jgi:hypothetical protein